MPLNSSSRGSPCFDYIAQRAKTSLPNLSAPAPARLYHYTRFEVADRILSTVRIRHTHIRTMNDLAEIKIGLRVFTDLMMKILQQDKQWNEDVRNFFFELMCKVALLIGDNGEREEIFSMLGREFEPRSDPTPLDIYIACFSESCDDLAMWYMYADKGGGICLGFDGEHLCNAHQRIYEPWREPFFGSVIYDVREFKHGIYDFVANIGQCLNDHFSKGVTFTSSTKENFSR
jgi:hypothetical protein